MSIENEIKRIERRIKFNLKKMSAQVQEIKKRTLKVEALLDLSGGQDFYGAVQHMNCINRASENLNQMYLEIGKMRVELSHLRLELEQA